MEDEEYLKYKDRFKTTVIFNLSASCCALLALLLFIFVECFEIGFEGIVLFKFSIFTEITRIIKAITSSHDEMFIVSISTGIYPLIVFVVLVCAGIYAIVDIIKNILNLTNLDKYSFLQYDKIKNRNKDNEKKVNGGGQVFLVYIISVIFEIGALLFSKFMSDEFNSFGGSDFKMDVSYFAEMTNVSWTIMFFIILSIGVITLFILARKWYKDVAFDIVKEEYKMKEKSKVAISDED